MAHLSFVAMGKPITQGSKTVIKRGAHVTLVDRNDMATKTRKSGTLKDWRETVAESARDAMWTSGAEMADAPVLLTCRFSLPRPDSHWLKSGKLRKGAPRHPVGDLDKYCRAVGDALTGVIYRDDVLVVELVATKAFAAQGEPGHVFVKVGMA